MSKTKIKVAFLFVIIIGVISYYVYDGFNKAPARLRINYQTIINDQIPQDMDGLQVIFISDLHYLQYFDNSRLDQLVQTVNQVNADVIIFTGDLIDRSLDDSEYDYLLNSFTNMQASHGKFAILGEADYKSEEINSQVETLLFDSSFETLKNEAITIARGTNNYINLVGIDSPINERADIEKAFSNIEEKFFTITAVHTPDIVNDIPQSSNIVVSGHSHGGQINIPLLGQVYNKPMAETYYTGKYDVRNIDLYVSNGVGTDDVDVRINAPAEIIVFTLKNK